MAAQRPAARGPERSMILDLLVHGGAVWTPSGLERLDVGIRGGRIVALGALGGHAAAERLDAAGLTVLPGVIDTQVHFREPGLEHKEDLGTGTAAAALGGVTAIFEMPNTSPSTTTAALLADKVARARQKAWVDFAFFAGATGEDPEVLAQLERQEGCCGVKIFMGSSTGSLLVSEDAALERVLRAGRRRVAVHCEDEDRLRERKALVAQGADPRQHPVWRDEESALRATTRLLRLARDAGRPVHVLHVTTAEELTLLAQHRDLATVEVTPQHLLLSAPDCYERLGTFAQMNPPIRGEHHRLALWEAVRNGLVDLIGSDHAPHTREEKARPYPQSPSGMPGVQTLLPLLLDQVARGALSLGRLVDLCCAAPQRVYNLARKGRVALGYDGDLTLVDLQARRTLQHSQQASRCGWTPFDGVEVQGWPTATVVRGRVVMRDGELLGAPSGEPCRFWDALER